jgi:hypothetical protein
MRSLEKLGEYLTRYFWVPTCWNRKPGPGQVVLNAPEEDREQFRKLKSDDVANFIDPGLAAWEAMPEEEKDRHRFDEENKRLLRSFDREIEKHRKFTC